VDRSGGYKGAKQRVVALKICTFFGAYAHCTYSHCLVLSINRFYCLLRQLRLLSFFLLYNFFFYLFSSSHPILTILPDSLAVPYSPHRLSLCDSRDVSREHLRHGGFSVACSVLWRSRTSGLFR
jgi:hypothetical protein